MSDWHVVTALSDIGDISLTVQADTSGHVKMIVSNRKGSARLDMNREGFRSLLATLEAVSNFLAVHGDCE